MGNNPYRRLSGFSSLALVGYIEAETENGRGPQAGLGSSLRFCIRQALGT